MTTAQTFRFIAASVAIATCMHAEDMTEKDHVEAHADSVAPPYLFFLKRDGGDGLLVYEQSARKTPHEPSLLTVMRTTGDKTDMVLIRVKVEALKEGSCSFRILQGPNDGMTTKAKKLLGIHSDSFEILFREVQGQMPKVLLSVKDTEGREQSGSDPPASAPQEKSPDP